MADTWSRASHLPARTLLFPIMADQAAVGVNVSKAASRCGVNFLLLRDASDTLRSATLTKLVVFSAALGIVPLTSYFASQKYLWNGTSRCQRSLC